MSRTAIARMLSIAACSALMAACTFGSTESAETAVGEFHRRFSAQEFGEIYGTSDEAMKETTTQEALTGFLSSLYEKTGPVQDTRRTGWNVNVSTRGKIVTLDYETDFANGSGTERFIFRLHDDGARLQGYNINSPMLITN